MTVDLRDFRFMPLYTERLQKSKAWLMCKREPALAFYMMNLWMRSWHEVPCGSLEDDDDVLADAAMCDPKTWGKVKDRVLRGWEKTGDRLFHPVVIEIAEISWKGKQTQLQRTEAARLALQQKRDKAATEDVTKTVTKTVTDHSTVTVTDIATGLPHDPMEGKGREGKGIEEGSELRSGAAAPLDPKTILWREGLATLRVLTKSAEGPTRKLLGKMVEAIGADHAALLEIIRKAEVQQPDDPVAWIRGAIQARSTPSLLGLAPDPSDPWGIWAWIARRTDIGEGTDTASGRKLPAINGFLVEPTAERIADASGLRPSWRGSWDAMAAWMDEDLLITEAPIEAIGQQAARMAAQGQTIGSMQVFDAAVRAAAAGRRAA